jgi:DNA primase
MISDDKKEEIREAADIVEVVGDYVRLKRSGNNCIGLCPFHDEKTPSFTVTPKLGIYKCFGCGASGDLFGFVMDMEGVGFQQALRTLAERYGVSLPDDHDTDESDEKHKDREGIYHALQFAGLYFFRELKESKEAEPARKYLENRGYDGAVIKKFGLGYSPAKGDALLKAATNEGIEEGYLLKADLIKPSKHNDGYYDTFRERLIFPIFNPSGKVIAFAGRVMGDKKTAKYINSAQTPVYNKSEVLYGVNFAKNEIRKAEEVILVEGYTDVITMMQNGISNVVASSGTALTPGQVKILKRYGSKIVMIYDSDTAGRAAMKRGMNIALAQGMDVDLLELPEDEDPDSFVKKYGKDSFLELKKKEAQDFVSFSIHQAEIHGEMDGPAGRTRVISRVLESIAEIPDPLARQVYVQHLHQKTQKYRNSSDRELFDQLGSIIKNKQKDRRNRGKPAASPPHPAAPTGQQVSEEQSNSGLKENRQGPVKKKPHYEKELIRLMVQYGDEMIHYIGTLCNGQLFEDDELREFYKDVITRYQDGKDVSVEHYAHREPPYPKLIGDVMLEKHTASERHAEKTGTHFQRDKDPFRSAKSTIKPLRLYYLKRYLVELADKTKTADSGKKIDLIKKQKRTQSEISHMERTPADELFPDPDIKNTQEGTPGKKFEYKMKNERNDS